MASPSLVPTNMVNLDVVTLRIWTINIPEISVQGYSQSEDDSVLRKVTSDRICKRITNTVLLDLSGQMYELSGPIDRAFQLKTGMPPRIIDHFTEGFQPDWSKVLADFYQAPRTPSHQKSIQALPKPHHGVNNQSNQDTSSSSTSSEPNQTMNIRHTIFSEPDKHQPESIVTLAEEKGRQSRSRVNSKNESAPPVEKSSTKKSPRQANPPQPLRQSPRLNQSLDATMFARPGLDFTPVRCTRVSRKGEQKQIAWSSPTSTSTPVQQKGEKDDSVFLRPELPTNGRSRNVSLSPAARRRTPTSTSSNNANANVDWSPPRRAPSPVLQQPGSEVRATFDYSAALKRCLAKTRINRTMNSRNVTQQSQSSSNKNALTRANSSHSLLRCEIDGGSKFVNRKRPFVTLSPKRSREFSPMAEEDDTEDDDDQQQENFNRKRAKLDKERQEKAAQLERLEWREEMRKREEELARREEALSRAEGRLTGTTTGKKGEIQPKGRSATTGKNTGRKQTATNKRQLSPKLAMLGREPKYSSTKSRSKTTTKAAPKTPSPKPPKKVTWPKKDVDKLKRILELKKPRTLEEWRIVTTLLEKPGATVEECKKTAEVRIKYKPPAARQVTKSPAINEDSDDETGGKKQRKNGVVAKTKAAVELREKMVSSRSRPTRVAPDLTDDSSEINAGDISADNSILAAIPSPRGNTSVKRNMGGARGAFIAEPFDVSESSSLGVPQSPSITEEEKKEQVQNARYVQHLMSTSSFAAPSARSKSRVLNSSRNNSLNISVADAEKKARRYLKNHQRVVLEDSDIIEEENDEEEELEGSFAA